VVDGVFRFTISEPSSESWNIQLLQPGLKLRDGKSYLVTFDAWAEKDRSFSAGLENSENYTGYGGSGTLTAGPNRKTFSFKVNKKGDDPKGRLSFSFGGDKTAISIDNVKVVELE
jgi:endoglucanase